MRLDWLVRRNPGAFEEGSLTVMKGEFSEDEADDTDDDEEDGGAEGEDDGDGGARHGHPLVVRSCNAYATRVFSLRQVGVVDFILSV